MLSKELRAIKAMARSGKKGCSEQDVENEVRNQAGLRPVYHAKQHRNRNKNTFNHYQHPEPTGEIIQLGEHRIICADSRVPSVKSLLLGDKSPDIVIFDPPYDEPAIYSYIPNAFSSMRQALVVFWDTRRAGAAHAAANKAGWEFRFELCWDNQGVAFRADNEPHWSHKTCGVFGSNWEWSNARATQFMPQKDNGDKIKFSSLFKHQKSRMGGHKHAKPDNWIACILSGIGLGGLVYDPFIGGGSTIRACDRTGSICVGCEVNQEYIEILRRDYEHFDG